MWFSRIADNDVEAVVAEVEALNVVLGAVADEGQRVVLGAVYEPALGPVLALPNLILRLGKANGPSRRASAVVEPGQRRRR